MLLRLQNGLASMRQMAREQERVANNLANLNTVGFKRDRTFTEALHERLDEEGAPRSDRATSQWADFTQGALDATGNPLDLALQGDGFFVLADEAAGTTLYTRAGRFMLDPEGTLRDPAGRLVEGEDGPIQLPPGGGTVEVGRQGDVRVGDQVVGQLRIVTFADPMQLRPVSGAAFDAAGQAPEPVDNPVVLQGYLESSNVDPMEEMTDMIAFFRQFESQQKVLQTTDQILGAVTRDLGKF